MYKRGILLFFLFSGILSCFCDDELPFWNVNEIDLFLVDTNGNNIDNDTITADSIGIIVDFEIGFVANHSLKSIFANTAMATSCPTNGESGMKDPITNITLTCDQPYNNFTAGESLNSIVQYGNQTGFQSFVDEVKDYSGVDFFTFVIIEKPTNLDSLQFTVQIDFASGLNKTDTSAKLFWQ